MPMPQPSSIVRALAALAVATLLAACSVLPKGQTVQIWQPPEDNVAISPAGVDYSLRVETPNTTGMLGDPAIVVMPTTSQVSTYKGARWSNPPALLVRQRLVDAFMAAQWPAVTTDDDHLFTDYSLGGDLRAYQSEYRGGAPVVVVRYDAQLRSRGSRHLLASHSFVVTETPSGAAVPQIVAAFGAADDALAQQVVAWATGAAKQDRAVNPDDAPRARRR